MEFKNNSKFKVKQVFNEILSCTFLSEPNGVWNKYILDLNNNELFYCIYMHI